MKTIGDAVMAVFDNPVEATSAALEMIDALNEFNHTISQELILKVGIHRGHFIAVTVNERIDYFGQTVNIAARVHALADANEVYVTADVYNSPGVSDFKHLKLMNQALLGSGGSGLVQSDCCCPRAAR